MSLTSFLLLALVAFVLIKILSKTRSGRPGRKKGSAGRSSPYQQRERSEDSFKPQEIREENTAERQLANVRCSEFRKRPLMNKSEYAVFCRLEALLPKSHRSYRVFAQVSLGEILGSDSKQAYWAINSKRADFVIIDRSGQPVAVVEYHGTGHYQGDAITCDAIKREACNSAGIAYIELPARYSNADITAISEHLKTEAA